MEESARIAAKEAAASGLNWTFAPMIDISRDARWGRVMEGGGEDTFLGSEIGAARVRGFQGDDLSSPETLAACAKHFAGYGYSESGKDYNTVVIGRHDLHNYVLPPFKAAKEAGVATFMNAFNDLDGIPATAHEWLVSDLLRGQWEYEGVVVSDWNSIGQLLNHGVARDLAHAGELALKAGTDMDMEGDSYVQFLEELVENGTIEESLIDEAVRRILTLKYELGLFDDPYKYLDKEREKNTLLHEDHLKASRAIARKSIVLLKNEKDLLPLSKDVSSVAVIGPLAKDKDAPIGNWRAQGESNSAVSFYEGLEAQISDDVKINYAEGCKLSIGPNEFPLPLVIEQEDKSGFDEAIAAAKKSEVVFMVLGEPAHMSGEARSRADIGLPGLQLDLLKEIHKVNKNIVLVLMNGRPLTLSWEAENIPAILETWFLGSEHGHAVADVITGKYNPAGKLTMSFPRHVGQVPIYYNKRITGRPESDLIFYEHHIDIETSPLFPFGHGLSYTTFDFSEPEVSVSGREVTISSTLENTGEVEGTEVLQFYIRDMVASLARSNKDLKAFESVTLKPGESRTVTVTLDQDDLSFYNHAGEQIFEPGAFKVFVGNSSANLKEKSFTLE